MKLNSFNAQERQVKSASIYRNRLSLLLGFAFLASVLLLASPNRVKAEESLTSVERVVPEFTLLGVDEQEWNAESLLGKFWVVNFWATWCPPCIEEIPSMNRAWEVLEPAGIGMLAINTGEDRGAVEEF